MKVRDLTKRVDEYKGRWTEAAAKDCPCMICFNAHDCGYFNSQQKWVTRMYCATMWNCGCPSYVEPQHVYATPRSRKCMRCGCTRAACAS